MAGITLGCLCSRSRPVTSTALSGPGQLRQQPCRWAACLRARGARGRSAAPSLQLRLRAGAGTGASASVTPAPRWTRLGVSACRDPAPSRRHHPPQSPWHPRRGPAGAPCRHSEGQGVPVCLPEARGQMTPLTKPPFKGHRSVACRSPIIETAFQNPHYHETAEVGPKS